MRTKDLREPKKYKDGNWVSLQACILGKKVVCPACKKAFRCYREGDYVCTYCWMAFRAYFA